MALGDLDGGRPADAVHGMCPYARSFLAAAISNQRVSAVVMATTCDQMRHVEALVSQGGDRPVFLMNVPATWQTDAARRLYRHELERLGRFLVQLGGEPPSSERLRGVMIRFDEARRSLRSMRQGMSARRFAEAVSALGSDELDWAAVAEAAVPGDNGPRREPVRLALVGGPLLAKDRILFDLLEQAGGRLVLDATTGGERTMPAEFDARRLRRDPLGELADAYFGAIPDAFRRPNTGLYDWLGEMIARRGVRGLLCWRYVWCDIWHGELYRLKRASWVPVLDIDAGYNDDGLFARTTARIEAFLEMLG
jgi:benzoyl-CoA reductase/2-hydroxyglutaryl-CoA dehydratase subunit BcrC/BadD/HgdB